MATLLVLSDRWFMFLALLHKCKKWELRRSSSLPMSFVSLKLLL